MEARRVAARAAGDVVDGRDDARGLELRSHGGSQIDEGLLRGVVSADDEALAETRGDVLAHFEAARADVRTYCGQDRFRGETIERDLEDARFHSAPPCMDCRDATGVGCGEKDGDAVRDSDCDGVTFARAHDAVRFDLQEIAGIAFGSDDRATMDLLRLIEARALEAYVGGQALLPLSERYGVAEGREITGGSRREAVAETCGFESRGAENAE